MKEDDPHRGPCGCARVMALWRFSLSTLRETLIMNQSSACIPTLLPQEVR